MDKPLALYRRFLWESKNISWVYTDNLSKLFESRRAYFEACGMAQHLLNDAQQRELDRLIVSATLAAESKMTLGAWGWTIRIPLKPWGLFCGVEPEGMVCARFNQLAPETAKDPIGSFTVQRVLGMEPMQQTSLIPRDTTTHLLVEQFFDESEQLPARVAIRDNEALMAVSMPDAEWDIVKDLNESDLFALFHELLHNDHAEPKKEPEMDPNASEKARQIKSLFAQARGESIGENIGDLKLMHESVFYYGCRCDAQRIRNMLIQLSEEEQNILWADSETVEVQCPRCGRTHVISRK